MIFKKFQNIINKYLLLNKYWIQYCIIFLLIVIIAFLFPKGKTLKYAYQLNDITRSPIIAPFTYPILKSEKKLALDLEEKKNLFLLFLIGISKEWIIKFLLLITFL